MYTNSQKVGRMVFATAMLVILAATLYTPPQSHFSANQDTNLIQQALPTTPLSGAEWANTSISIDALLTTHTTNSGNWTWAASQPWCSGSGTEMDPYIIENITFTISAGMNGLSISNNIGQFVSIINCTFLSADETHAGLYLINSSTVMVQNSHFYSNGYGIYATNTSSNLIQNCFINGSYDFGLRIISSDNTLIHNNTIQYTTHYASWKGYGIIALQSDHMNFTQNSLLYNIQQGYYSEESEYNRFENNTFMYNERGGLHLGLNSHNNSIINNTAVSNGIVGKAGSGISAHGGSSDCTIINNTAKDNTGAGIFISGYNDNISFNKVSNNGNLYGYAGIDFYLFGNHTVYNNTMIGDRYGIRMRLLSSNDETLVSENYISANDYGIYAENNAGIFQNNTIHGGSMGLYLRQITDFTFENNTISGNYAIRFDDSTNFVVHNNTIRHNSQHGIYLYYVTIGVIGNNSIVSNNLDWKYGIWLSSSSHVEIKDNYIHSGETNVRIQSSDYITIQNNEMHGTGIAYESGANNHIDGTNTVNGDPMLYIHQETDAIVDQTDLVGYSQVVLDECDQILIHNIELTNFSTGIIILESEQISLQNVNISLGYTSIAVANGSNIEIEDCYFESNYGTGFQGTDFISVRNNKFNQSAAIFGHYCNNIEVHRNDFNATYGEAISFDYSSQITISENNLESCGDGIQLTYSENVEVYGNIASTSNYFIQLDDVINGGIYLNNISNQYAGFDLENSVDILIDQNDLSVVEEIYYGYYNDNVTISNNYCEDFYYGITEEESTNLLISDNEFYATDENPFYLYNIINMTFYNNIVNGSIGFTMEELSNITITENSFLYLKEGLQLANCDNLSISNNIFFNTSDNYALQFDEESHNSTIYQNLFVKNFLDAFDLGNNTWDLAGYGNYWDNHVGTDENDDGIYTNAHNIDGDSFSVDHYPIVSTIATITSQPADISVNQTDLGSVSWEISSFFNITQTYVISIDGNPIQTGTWRDGDSITINLVLLSLTDGNYSISIVVYDMFFNETTATFTLELTTPEDPDDTGNTTPPPSTTIGGGWIFLIVVAVVGAVSFAGLMVLKTKNPAKYEEIMNKFKAAVPKANKQ